jgi:integrase
MLLSFLFLFNVEIRKAKPGEASRKLFDGGGLYLQIEPSGGKLWRYKYRIDGKENRVSLGKYPKVSLKEARKKHQEARDQVSQGIDPSAINKAKKTTKDGLLANSFQAVANEWHEDWKKNKTARHAEYTLARLEKNVFPFIGSKPISELRAPDVLEVCKQLENRGTIEMAHRVKIIISQVMRYAIGTGRAENDPCPNLRGLLETAQPKPLPSLTHPADIAKLMRAIDGYKGTRIVQAALRLAPLVFVRPGELRKAKWADVDFENKEWTFIVSKQRANVKVKRTLIVPLSHQALAILNSMQPLTGNDTYVFPGLVVDRPISDATINKALRTLGYDTKTEMTGHGFRAMARTAIAERLHLPKEWIERQLSHKTDEKLGESYDRTQFLDDRRNMMQSWADYLDELKAPKPEKKMRPSQTKK